jgi:hypothetical protein
VRLSFDRLWVVIALALPALLSLLVPLPAVDLAYQVRAGDEILASGMLPAVDTWTFTIAGTPWVDQQWLAQVLLALGYRFGGWELLAVVRAGLVVMALGLLLAAIIERGAPVRTAAVLSLATFLVAAPTLALRPQLFGIVIFAALLWLISVRQRWPWAYLLMPVLVIVWANVHGSFVLAPLVLGYAWLEDVVIGRESRRALLVLLIATLATLLNPYGFGAWSYASDLGTDPVIRETVSEWQRTSPLTIPGALFYASLVLVVIFLFAHARTRRRVLPPDWIWVAGWGFIGAWAERGLAWWPFAAAFVVGTVVGRATSDAGEPARGPRSNRVNAVVAAALMLLIVAALPWWRPPDALTGRVGLLSYAPSALAQELRRSSPGGRLYAEQTWASWFEWAAPAQRTFVDSRFELFPSSVMTSYQTVAAGGAAAIAELASYRVDRVAIDRDAPLAATLRAAGWNVVMESEEGVVLASPDSGD